MRGFCKDDEKRIPKSGRSGLIEYKDLLGASVYIKSLTMGNGRMWNKDGRKEYKVEDISFRISTDGKCITVLKLSDCPGKTFTLKDIEFKLD